MGFNVWKHFIIILALFSPALASAQVNAEQVLAIGRNVLGMDDYMLAIQYFNQAIKAKPYLADPYFYRALAKLQLEDYQGAEDDCTLSLERNKFKIDTYRLRGFSRQVRGLDSLAVIDYREGLNLHPNDKYLMYYKAVAEINLDRYEDADSTFKTLLRLFPAFEEGHAALARLHTLEGDTIAAYQDLQTAIGKGTAVVQPYLLRAELYAKQGKWDLALADMDKAISLQPREPDYYLNRGFIRYNLDDFFGAMSDYNYTIELNPDNEAALFNRALLRYEVKDLERSAADFNSVLQINPQNFHALLNRGLVNLERRRPKEALSDFEKIRVRYPRYHNAYYALAEAYRDLGNMRQAMAMVHEGDELVRKYVKNPDLNPLDRPAVQSGMSRMDKEPNDTTSQEEQEMETIDKFNRLVTVSASASTELSYNEKIKGRVQDRDINVEPQEAYSLTFVTGNSSLSNHPVYFKEMDEFNNRGWSASRLYLHSGSTGPFTETTASQIFALADNLESRISEGSPTAADWLNLGVARLTLKDYEAAITAFTKALEINSGLATALVGRAYSRAASDATQSRLAINDYDEALKIDPNLAFVWMNKGNLYYASRDYTSAISCFSKALELDPSLGAALYNRGLTYLQTGNRRMAFTDLSKAGELGILPSYNLLKRMK